MTPFVILIEVFLLATQVQNDTMQAVFLSIIIFQIGLFLGTIDK